MNDDRCHNWDNESFSDARLCLNGTCCGVKPAFGARSADGMCTSSKGAWAAGICARTESTHLSPKRRWRRYQRQPRLADGGTCE